MLTDTITIDYKKWDKPVLDISWDIQEAKIFVKIIDLKKNNLKSGFFDYAWIFSGKSKWKSYKSLINEHKDNKFKKYIN